MQSDDHKIQYRAQNSFSLREMNKVFNEWVKKLLPIGKGINKMNLENQGSGSNTPAAPNSDAVFLAWQETPGGEVFALYNIIAKQNPLYGSTVSEKTLQEQKIQIPPTPPPQGELKRMNFEKR